MLARLNTKLLKCASNFRVVTSGGNFREGHDRCVKRRNSARKLLLPGCFFFLVAGGSGMTLLLLRTPLMLLLLREAVGLALCFFFPRLAYDRFDMATLRCYTPATKTTSHARAHKCLAALSHQPRGRGSRSTALVSDQSVAYRCLLTHSHLISSQRISPRMR